MASETNAPIDWRLVAEQQRKLIIGLRESDTISAESQLQTDRGEAILGGALVQDRLRTLILSRFTNIGKDAKWLLTQDGPLGTFKSQIAISDAMGLITTEVNSDLTLIRKIRNGFAHWKTSADLSEPSALPVDVDEAMAAAGFQKLREPLPTITFSTANIRDRCRALKCPEKYLRLDQVAYDKWLRENGVAPNRRACACLCRAGGPSILCRHRRTQEKDTPIHAKL